MSLSPFISSADLSAYLSNSQLDSLLAQIALDAACEAVRGYCDQNLETTTETALFLDGLGSKQLRLPAFPVVTLTELVVYAGRDDASPTTLVENTDYVLNYRTGVLTRIDGELFPNAPQSVKATFTYGSDTVPSDARLVALQVAARIYDIGMVANETVGGVSTTYAATGGQLTLDEKRALYRYRASS